MNEINLPGRPETIGDHVARLERIRRAAIDVLIHASPPEHCPPIDKLNALGRAIYGDSWRDA